MSNIEISEFKDTKNILDDFLVQLKEKDNEKIIETQYYDLDEILGGGLHNQNLIVLAGRPNMGKNTFALNIVTNITNQDIPVAIFSLEQSKEQLISKILSMETLVDINKIRTGKIESNDWNKLENEISSLSDKKLYIDDSSVIEFDELKYKCIKLKKEKNVEMILIDNLELLQTNEEINLVKELKILSKELDIPIIIIANLSSELERRIWTKGDARPMLCDLKKEIVKNSDVIMFLYREGYYNCDSEEDEMVEIIIAKNRCSIYGNGTINLEFFKKYSKFVNLENKEYEIKKMKQDFIEQKQITFRQELLCLKKYTDILDEIDINEVKQLIKCDNDANIYVLLNNGTLYINNKLNTINIEKIFYIDIVSGIYRISKDNKIFPMKQLEKWNDFDFYLYNEDETYKKIITGDSFIICLTNAKKLKIISYWNLLGIAPENQIDIDDIFIKETEKGDKEPYIVKGGKEIQLFIRG